jgi:hypothetical protein
MILLNSKQSQPLILNRINQIEFNKGIFGHKNI